MKIYTRFLLVFIYSFIIIKIRSLIAPLTYQFDMIVYFNMRYKFFWFINFIMFKNEFLLLEILFPENESCIAASPILYFSILKRSKKVPFSILNYQEKISKKSFPEVLHYCKSYSLFLIIERSKKVLILVLSSQFSILRS